MIACEAPWFFDKSSHSRLRVASFSSRKKRNLKITRKNSFQARPVFFPVLGTIRVYEVFFNSGINTVLFCDHERQNKHALAVIRYPFERFKKAAQSD